VHPKQSKAIRAFEITEEPKGKCYEALLDFASERCSQFSLVWRDQLDFETSAKEIKQPLRHFIVSRKRTTIWPGTEIFGGKSTVIHYRITKQTMRILRQVKSLYSWLSPKFPEDLAFYTDIGCCWLATVSHEGMAWIVDNDLDPVVLKKHVPSLRISVVTTDPYLLVLRVFIIDDEFAALQRWALALSSSHVGLESMFRSRAGAGQSKRGVAVQRHARAGCRALRES